MPLLLCVMVRRPTVAAVEQTHPLCLRLQTGWNRHRLSLLPWGTELAEGRYKTSLTLPLQTNKQ
jgi:hypothetical protein